MKSKIIEAFKRCRAAHTEIYALVAEASKEFTNERDLEELADFAYALREMQNLMEDLRSDMGGKRAIVERAACAIIAEQDHLGSIRTKYCTATPKCDISVTLPNKNKKPEEYAALMTGLGIPKEHWDKTKVDWNGLVDYISNQAANAENLPPWLDKLPKFTVYRLKIVMRKEVDAESQQSEEFIPF